MIGKIFELNLWKTSDFLTTFKGSFFEESIDFFVDGLREIGSARVLPIQNSRMHAFFTWQKKRGLYTSVNVSNGTVRHVDECDFVEVDNVRQLIYPATR